MISLLSTCQVSGLACSASCARSNENLAQRWTAFPDIGPSPSGRRYHSMASDGTRVFVLGGALSIGVPVDDVKPIHVLDTGMYILFVISFG